MKLIICTDCQDVFKLDYIVRTCKCGKAGGYYEGDGYFAKYWGDTAMPLGFANSTLRTALKAQPQKGMGAEFTAFVIPVECGTILKVKENPFCSVSGEVEEKS